MSETITLDGRTYPVAYTSRGEPFIREIPPGWSRGKEASRRYGVPADVIYRWIYAQKVRCHRALDYDGVPRWYIAPPPPDYTPPTRKPGATSAAPSTPAITMQMCPMCNGTGFVHMTALSIMQEPLCR